MGQDVDGFCALLREAGHEVLTNGIPTSAPRVHGLPREAATEVLELYRLLGGRHEEPILRPGGWDIWVDGVLVELDEQLHFNRDRAVTLKAESYERLRRFPLEIYREYCVAKEAACLKHGRAQGRWMNASTESHFGPCAPRGQLLLAGGSSRWKQRALYDTIKDFTQLDPHEPRLARVAIWDVLPESSGRTVEAAVHAPPETRLGDAAWALITRRSGVVG